MLIVLCAGCLLMQFSGLRASFCLLPCMQHASLPPRLLQVSVNYTSASKIQDCRRLASIGLRNYALFQLQLLTGYLHYFCRKSRVLRESEGEMATLAFKPL